MGIGGFLKGVGRAAWKVVDPIFGDEVFRGIGRIARGKFKEGFSDVGRGIWDNAKGGALLLGGAGLAGAGPLAGTLSGVGSSIGSAASTVGSGVGSGIGKVASGIGGKASGIAGWASKNPELAANLAGTAADVYGANQMGATEDREYERRAQFDPLRMELMRSIMDRRKAGPGAY